MAVDQETRAFLEQARRNATKPRHEQTVAEARAGLAGLGALFAHGPAMAQEKELSVPVAGAELPVRVLVPNGVPSGLIVYFHGGGWVIGSVAEFTPLGRVLADATGCAVALVGYRRAPENPYPGPVDDAWAGLLWCTEHVSVLAGRDVPVLVAGDSAGANLAAATTLRARYLPDLERRSEAEASPLRAADHRGLPPAVIVTAEHDVLRDEGDAYAQALLDAGVAVTLRRFPGQMHAFLMMVGLLPGSEAGARFIGAEVHRMLHGPATVVQEGKRS